MQTANIGVDISKAWVDTCIEHGSARQRVANTSTGLRKWLRTLPAGSRIGMEASGPYHELLAHLAHDMGFGVFVINPREIRHYARSLGLRAKTDRLDAALIARFIAHEHAHLRAFVPASPELGEIVQLVRRRAKAVTLGQAARKSFRGIDSLEGDLATVLASLDRLIGTIDARLRELSAACPQRQQAAKRLRSIDGVGPLVSMALIGSLERYRFATSDAFVAFHGLDTYVQESGTHAGRRRLTKSGCAELRRLAFNAGMAAVKTKAWKPVYEHYRARGWPPTAALNIIARRILRTAWSIYKYNTTFDPTRPAAHLT